MSNRVLFIVFDKPGNKLEKKTKESITANIGKEDTQVFVNFDDPDHKECYYLLKSSVNAIVNDVKNFDYVCLIPNGSTLNSNSRAIFNEYQVTREDNIVEIYLPLSVFMFNDSAVLLNKHIWNSQVATVAGVLDIDLANRQIDSTIFGAFVPTDLFFDEKNYSPNVQYYQQYHLLNNFADGDNLVLGIPKVVLTINDWDFQLKDVSDEEKIKHFNLARYNWSEEVMNEKHLQGVVAQKS